MDDKESSEYREGYQAFKPGHKPEAYNPYPWNYEWWRHEQWNKGWKAAQNARDDDDDYDDGGRGSAGWPSGTGNPSGGGRQNA
jgi:hypothetical protein